MFGDIIVPFSLRLYMHAVIIIMLATCESINEIATWISPLNYACTFHIIILLHITSSLTNQIAQLGCNI